MENIIITNRKAYLVEENTNNQNNYEFISEDKEKQAANILSVIKSDSNKINYTNSNNSESKSIAENPTQSKSFCEKSEILSLDSNSNNNKDILSTNENQDRDKSTKNNIYKKINPKTLIKAYIGHVSEAHHYILDNEFIIKGYRINFHSCKRISRSLCMCHNETINVWTHFIGAILTILFMFLVIFNIGPINPESFLKSYFEKTSKGNYSKSILDKSVSAFKSRNDSLANFNNRIQFDIGNYLINDDSQNNYNNNKSIHKNNNETFNYNKTAEDLKADKTGNIRSFRINNAVEAFDVNIKLEKLKLLKSFEIGVNADAEIRNNLTKLEANQDNRKFIEVIKINKNEEINASDRSRNPKLEVDNGLFERINNYVDVENLKNYLTKNFLLNNFSSDIENITKPYIEDFNNIFISTATNRVIEKYNSLLDSMSSKNTTLTELSVLENLNTFLKKILNYLRDLLPESKEEIDFNLRNLQESKEAIFESKDNPTESDQDPLNFSEWITPKWPVLIHLVSALFCLCCSTTFHLFSAYSSKVGDVLSRLDYAGISVLIAGSCFPPYYYMFCCTILFLSLYLTFICTFAVIVFFISLMSKFNTPEYRRLRGFLFLSLGVSTALPMIHYIFLFDESLGMIEEVKVIYWAIGGIVYISGCLIYIARFPERFCPGKFDLIGSSHQIWHIFVVTGVVFHHVASISNYHDRLSQGCPNLR